MGLADKVGMKKSTLALVALVLVAMYCIIAPMVAIVAQNELAVQAVTTGY